MYDRSSGRLWAAALAGASIAALAVGTTCAQTPSPQTPSSSTTTREQLNPAKSTEAASRRRADIFSAPEQAPCPFKSSDIRFTLKSVQVSGSSILSANDIQRAYADMVGRPQPVAAICEIRDRLAIQLFRRGVLARVEVPAQRILPTEGRVRLEVIEARIVAVRYHTVGNIGPAQRKVEQYLDRLRGLAPFDLDTAQHYLLLANDIPGVQVIATPKPSTAPAVSAEAARGALDLDVQISRRALDEVAAVQNTSSKTLGPWSGVVRVDLNSFTRFGERTSLIAYSTLGNQEQEVVQLLEEARFGGHGLTARASFAYGRSRPGDVLAPLKLKGESYVGAFEMDYPLVHLRRKSLTLGTGMDFVNQNTEFPGGGALSDDSLRVVWARAEGSGQHLFGAPVAGADMTTSGSLSLEVRKGLDTLGASRAGTPSLSRIDGKPDAMVVRADGQGSVLLDPAQGRLVPLALAVHVQGQWADKPLLSYEEQAIGNLTIGRGYDPDALSGDRVIASEFKAQVGPIALWRGFSLAPYGFYDVARVTNLDPGSQDRTVRSVGGGAELRLTHGLRADVAYAMPLDKPFAAATTTPPARVLLQIVFAH